MGYVKQRRVRSQAENRLLRWRLKQGRMGPLPRRRDLDRLTKQAESDLRRNAGRWGEGKTSSSSKKGGASGGGQPQEHTPSTQKTLALGCEWSLWRINA